jgi:probable phosphoglycerate mutase
MPSISIAYDQIVGPASASAQAQRCWMRLILVRHGRPNEDQTDAPHDPPLNDDGWRQARATSRLLANEGVTHIVASPLLRALQTAEPLAEKLKLPVDIIEGWAEADRSASRYRSTETLRAEGREAWARFLADPIRYLGGDPVAFRSAVLKAMAETIARSEDPDARVVAFTHGLPINVVLAHTLGLESVTHFLVAYGSVTRLRRREDGRLGVSSVNETGHHRWDELTRRLGLG